MKALVQRVSKASVTIGGSENRPIGHGLVVLLGVSTSDSEGDCDWLARKVVNLRIFPAKWPPSAGHRGSDDSKNTRTETNTEKASEFDRTIQDVGGEILVVSQFTLYADTRKGRRPDFTAAAGPDQARRLYEKFVTTLKSLHPGVVTGEFGAMMRVDIHNEGPVTIIVDTVREGGEN